MGTIKAQNWKEKATEAFSRYLAAVEGDLNDRAGVVEIEAAMLAHYQAMMSETMQALVDSQGLSPRARTNET